ncbi:CoA ester lyase [Paraburkholderia sp. USG1]|uniref:HpcH/HpaI aldolase/citrate lyase family protein n=1 Tax=Paraburkholderia sp. USG1 TaxID=2952268 RepID=UPI00286479DF|nr:CoA ester lyase [Paraburkholderia sp. USG1]MDR8394722.1 CoA ester lyase [Paraburkholderia sp. USG1]
MSLPYPPVSTPIWRSMLFVPAHVEKFIARAHERGADACILDLEDSVPLAQKATARHLVRSGAQRITAQDTAVLVRVNQPWDLAEPDLEAAVGASVSAIVLPKVNTPDIVNQVSCKLDQLEAQRGLIPGHTRVIAQIEDVQALPRLDDIATSSSRLLGMILGSEDFSVSAGMAPVPQALMLPNQMVLYACRRAGILPFGFPGSIADFADLDAFRQQVRLACQLGFVGAFCIHPSQVTVVNDEFTPSPEELAHALGVLAAFEAASREGRAAAEYRGKMVDPPVVAQAQELLRRQPPRRSASQEHQA